MIPRDTTEKNHGGCDEENNNEPAVQVDHPLLFLRVVAGTAVKLRLTGVKYAARQGDRERERDNKREMSRYSNINIST